MSIITLLSKHKNTYSEDCYIIAEIGNNHGGSLATALKMVDIAKECGVSAVKFQKRSNRELFMPEFFNTPYDNPNSFGDTYGAHREFLELTIEDMSKLQIHSESLGLDFIVTPFDFESLDQLESIGCRAYKIASADLVHIPLIKKVVMTHKPIIFSSGSSSLEDIHRAFLELSDHPFTPALLHCTAAYPCPIDQMNLNCVTTLRNSFPKALIGLSDHESGIDAAPIAYMLGARIFEKHFTLDHTWKGTDNCFSLMPEGMRRFVRNLKRIPSLLGSDLKVPADVEAKPIYKMRKSIVYSNKLPAGHVLTIGDFSYKCPGEGLEPYHVYRFIGKHLAQEVSLNQPVTDTDVR